MGRPQIIRIVWLVVFAASTATAPFGIYALIVSLPSLRNAGIGAAGLIIALTTFPAAIVAISLFALTHRRRHPPGFPVQQKSDTHSS